MSMRIAAPVRSIAVVVALLAVTAARAEDVKVAVAANFTEPIKPIAQLFAAATGHKVVASFGATGQLYAQITQGAPFEVLLAADKATPAKAVAEGLAVDGSTYTYAVGRLALYSRSPGLVTGEATLRRGTFAKIAIANPATAPYGAAAIEVMMALGVHDALAARIVRGQSIAQTFQFVATGNAEVGLVALAQVTGIDGGSRWIVPGNLHKPILQDAVLLRAGENSPAARAFLAFLRGRQARDVIEKLGYGLSD